MSNIVKLNIGGAVFQTNKSTLTKFDGFFRVMLETGVPVEKDEAGCIFVDRDPKHFLLILNFLRDGRIELPKKYEDIRDVWKEADFYGLEEMREMCKNAMAETLREFENDNHFLRTMQWPSKPTMIINIYLAEYGEINYILDPSELKQFLLEYQQKLDIYFRFCKDGDLHRHGDTELSLHYQDPETSMTKSELENIYYSVYQYNQDNVTRIEQAAKKFLQKLPNLIH